MEKLLNLLNEYEKKAVVHWYERSNDEGVLTCRYIKENFLYYCEEASTIAISKYYGFIKWLVENDKIDGLKFYGENEYTPIGVNAKSDIDQVYSVEEQIIMLLSISDTPIEDLISYLK